MVQVKDKSVIEVVGQRGPVVPLKHRTDCPTARELFATIMANQDFGPVARTLIREGKAEHPAQAALLIEAFVQWYAAGSVTKTKSYVMFAGPVDEVLHAAILNSKWYMAFCHETTGVYTHHEPISETGLSEEDAMDAAAFTARLLKETWGAELSTYLRHHIDEVASGKYSAASVSCVGNGAPFDIVPVERVYY